MEFQNNSAQLCKLSCQVLGMAPIENNFKILWSVIFSLDGAGMPVSNIFHSWHGFIPPEVMFCFNVNNLYGVMHLREDTLKILHSITVKTHVMI